MCIGVAKRGNPIAAPFHFIIIIIIMAPGFLLGQSSPLIGDISSPNGLEKIFFP
jgi:hypothetical protein